MYHSSQITEYLKQRNIKYIHKGVNASFDTISSINNSKQNSIVWSNKINFEFSTINASTLILPISDANKVNDISEKCIFLVENPRLIFTLILNCFFKKNEETAQGTNDFKMFSYHEGIFIGNNSTISSLAKIGNNVIIHPNVVIYPNVKIGNNVEIGAGSIIGATGFGYVKDEQGNLIHFPHTGGVTIHDNVSIGANSCIDRGGIDDTEIFHGVKIGNFAQIAHNVKIKENCLIAGRVQIGGGSIIGTNTIIWPSTIVSNKIVIGKNCEVKMGSVVINNLKDNAIVSGNFAIPHNQHLRDIASKRLKKS